MSSRAVIYGATLTLLVAGGAAIGWKAYDLGQRTERAEWLERENSDLRETRKEATRLVAEVKEKQDAYNEAIGLIRDFERRPTFSQLRHKELAALVARADADRLRAHAEDAERDIEVTEGERRAFGIEAAEASAAAHALNEQKATPSRPTPPTRPPQP